MRILIILYFIPGLLIAQSFQDYWYRGAEITTYELSQYRYGEMHRGTAVMIYVTENFLKDQQVKHEYGSKEYAVPILKLNKTRNFLTGIYPYSTMTSVFHPVVGEKKPLKINTSIQEWCGHTWLQMNHKDGWYISSYSYFQKEADQFLNLPEMWIEDGIWTLVRIDPDQLPVGDFIMMPTVLDMRFAHTEISAVDVVASKSSNIYFKELRKKCSLYSLRYANGRTLKIYYEAEFPHRIWGWKEKYSNQSSNDPLETTAVLMEQKITDYWSQNKNKHRKNREDLGLD